MKRAVKSLMGRAAGMAGIYARNFHSKLTIVAFHRVNDQIESDGLTCSSRKFQSFCQFFSAHFRVVPLADQIALCRAGGNSGGTLSITFDDGYEDNFEVAVPILESFGLPAVFFVATSFIGTEKVAPWDHALGSKVRWMTWDQIRMLASRGFEIGDHTHNHINLGQTNPDMVREDLLNSRKVFRAELGRQARFFAYPFGGADDICESTREIVRELGFQCCVSCFGGTNSPAADPFYLKRIGIADWFRSPHQFGFELVRRG